MSDMERVASTKDTLFAIRGRSTAASVRQTIFSRCYPFHALVFEQVFGLWYPRS